MAEFPISIEDANKEIKALISEKGLDVITSKMIRKHLEAKFKCDFEEHKSKLDFQIESCIMEMANEEKKVTKAAKKEKKELIEKEEMKKERSPSTASSDSEAEEDGLSKIKINKNDIINSTSSTSTNANKSSKSAEKRKAGAKNVDAPEDDMATAIKRRRSNAVIPKKKDKQAAKTNKEKSTKNKGKGGGGMFTNMCALSPELATLLGRRYSRRSDVVKEMWNYLRANNLQDPKNKQFYYLDEPLKKIFGKGAKRIKAFGMMGKLKCHVKDIRNLDEATRQIAEAEISEMLAATANEGESEEATNESTSGQHLDEDDDEDESVDTDVDQQDDESNEPSSEVKVDADESNISYAKSEELDEKQPSTSTSAYQQEEGRVDEQNGGGQQDSSDSSSESETSSDDSGHDF